MKNSIFSVTSSLLAFASITLFASGATQAGVIAHWDFEEGAAGSAASSITDISGNGHNGTPINGPVYESIANNGTGLRFDGADDRVFVADSSDFLTNSLTVEAILSHDSLFADSVGSGLDQIVFRGDNRGGLDPFYLAIDSGGRLRFVVTSNSSATLISSELTGVNIGELFHAAGTIDDATGAMKLFINGVLVASTTTADRPTASLSNAWTPGVGIGNIQSHYNQFFDGVIADVRLSDVALSPDQFLAVNSQNVLEPATLGLMTLGLYGIGYRRLRSKKVA